MTDAANKQAGKILVGMSGAKYGTEDAKYDYLTLALGNRHGLIAGATGTGKTVTLQTLAEGFSNAGVSVFAADIKSDLSGISMPGDSKKPFVQRAENLDIKYVPDQFPTVFWDLYGEQGHPIRTTVSDMGPLLMARLLECNDVQEGIINIIFKLADDKGLLLLDMKDFRALLQYVSDNAADLRSQYGNIHPSSVGAIQRQLLVLENQGGEKFFGEPALDINDFMRTDRDGRGVINIMAADKLMATPRLYATFLLWLMSELFEELPEVGDQEKPKLVFFFDEAHLLFDNAPKDLLTSIEQVIRLIRSKGIGIFFVSQNPMDVPDSVLGQLGNRVQHALRSFTPRDQRAVRAAAETFRQNPNFDTTEAITQLEVGEALVSMLEGKGAPSVVARSLIAPPMARVGPVTPQERQQMIKSSSLLGKYDTGIDRESAFEILQKKSDGRMEEAGADEAKSGGILDTIGGWFGGGSDEADGKGKTGGRKRMSTGQVIIRSAAQSAARSIGTQISRAILRGVLGSMRR
jgi:uncharacterized protein